MVEHLKVLISRAPKGPYGRAPKGDGGLISRACLRILISRADGGLISRACYAPCRSSLLGPLPKRELLVSSHVTSPIGREFDRLTLTHMMDEREIPHPAGPLLSSPLWSSPLKGDGGLISRACLRILISRAP